MRPIQFIHLSIRRLDPGKIHISILITSNLNFQQVDMRPTGRLGKSVSVVHQITLDHHWILRARRSCVYVLGGWRRLTAQRTSFRATLDGSRDAPFQVSLVRVCKH